MDNKLTREKANPGPGREQAETRTGRGGYWVEVTVETTPEAAEVIAEILIEGGCGGVVYHDPALLPGEEPEAGEAGGDPEETPGAGSILLPAPGLPYRVTGYLPLRNGLDEELNRIKGRIKETGEEIPVGKGEITLRRVKEEEWANAWKEHFHPETVGRLIITPSWIEVKPSPAETVIRIDPGMAFGTGNHPSTKLSLILIQEAIKGGETVYDIGAGSGILAIAAAKLGAGRVVAVDIDPVAVEVARENILENGVAERVTVMKGDLLRGLAKDADLIIANIIAAVIMEITPEAAGLLKPGGLFISSGIIDSKAEEVRDALTAAGFIIRRELTAGGWVAFMAGRAEDA